MCESSPNSQKCLHQSNRDHYGSISRCLVHKTSGTVVPSSDLSCDKAVILWNGQVVEKGKKIEFAEVYQNLKVPKRRSLSKLLYGRRLETLRLLLLQELLNRSWGIDKYC